MSACLNQVESFNAGFEEGSQGQTAGDCAEHLSHISLLDNQTILARVDAGHASEKFQSMPVVESSRGDCISALLHRVHRHHQTVAGILVSHACSYPSSTKAKVRSRCTSALSLEILVVSQLRLDICLPVRSTSDLRRRRSRVILHEDKIYSLRLLCERVCDKII